VAESSLAAAGLSEQSGRSVTACGRWALTSALCCR